MSRLSKKNNNYGFHPGSAHACLLWMRRTFRVPFLTLPFGIGIIVEHPWFITCYYVLQKNMAKFHVFPANLLTNFQPVRFLLPRQIFRMCKWSVWIVWAAILFKPVSSAIILTIGGLSPSQLAPLPHFDHLLTRLVFQNEGRLPTFSRPSFKALCQLKTIVLDRVTPP